MIDDFLYTHAASTVSLREQSWQLMGGGVVGVGFMVNPNRGRDMRRRKPSSAAHPHREEDLMTLILTAIGSYFLGVLSLIYFLRHYAHFDFLPIEKAPTK